MHPPLFLSLRIGPPTRLLAIASGLLTVLTFSTPAVAAQPASAKALALAQEAQQAMLRGDSEAGIRGYRAALEMDPGLHRVRFELARLLASTGQLEESAREFSLVVEALPDNSAARRGEATALLMLGRYAEARRKLEEGLTALPSDGQLAHSLARLLATAPVDAVRDGELALRLALAVYEVKKLPETAETLAMAYAETGNFDKAIEVQRQLITEAEKTGDERRVEPLRERLLSYLRQEPWRAASPGEIAMATEPPESQRP